MAFDAAGLIAEARRADALVMLVPAPGDFVRSGAPLFQLFEPTAAMSDRRLLRSVVLQRERTMDQDAAFAFRILVDVAVKALSPAINDPTSAVMCIDQLHDLLAQLGSRRLDVGHHRDADGRVRLMIDRPTWEDYVSLAVDEIRHFGVEQLQVMRRLRAMFEDLQRVVPDERKAADQPRAGSPRKGREADVPGRRGSGARERARRARHRIVTATGRPVGRRIGHPSAPEAPKARVSD